MNKQEMKQIREEQKRIADAGWVPLYCDNWNKNHFLKLGPDRLHKKERRILCENCILKEEE